MPDFEIIGELGRGGMGIMYKARQLSRNRVVALKVIRKDRLVHEEAVQRFRREAQAAQAYAAFATHDARLIRVIANRAREFGLAPDRYEFQMLHGIRPDLHRTTRELGVRLRVLVPFGEDWYGYFLRRLAERPANLRFFLTNLARG